MTLLKLAASVNDTVGHCSNLFSGVLNKSNLGNLGISVILLSALRVSGFGMNFFVFGCCFIVFVVIFELFVIQKNCKESEKYQFYHATGKAHGALCI
jgi:hypothetical protein